MRAALALTSVALAGLLFAAPPAQAEDEASCRDQIEALCADSAPDTPERRACVKEKGGKLTEPCQKTIGYVKDAQPAQPAAPPASGPGGFQGLVQACQKDRARLAELCQVGRPAGENPMPCLIEHADEFSESCRDWLREAEKAQAQKASGAKPSAGAKPPTAN
jgi:hypothetical protein